MTALALPHVLLPRIAVLGAGHVGPVIARVAIEAGYNVSIAASGDPEKIELIAQGLAPGGETRRGPGAGATTGSGRCRGGGRGSAGDSASQVHEAGPFPAGWQARCRRDELLAT